MTENKIIAPTLAFTLALFSYFLFTLGDTLGKWLQSGYQAPQILLTINIFGFIIMSAVAIKTRGLKHAYKSRKWQLHLIRGVIMTLSTLLVLFALKKLPLADFYGIVFLNPIWVAVISFLFLKEKIPPTRWIAIFVGFLGVLVIAGAEFTTINAGFFAALAASILGASSALLARHIGGHESPTIFGISTHLVMIVVNACLLPGTFVMPSLTDFCLMAGYGIMLSFAMMGISYVFSRSHAVSQIAPLQYTQMLWGIILGWVVFDHAPTENVLAGALLVIGAGAYILRSLHRGRLMNRA